jgi:hypothetical protein
MINPPLEELRQQQRTTLRITTVRQEGVGLLVKGNDLMAVSASDLPVLRELIARLADEEVPTVERDGAGRLHGPAGTAPCGESR